MTTIEVGDLVKCLRGCEGDPESLGSGLVLSVGEIEDAYGKYWHATILWGKINKILHHYNRPDLEIVSKINKQKHLQH